MATSAFITICRGFADGTRPTPTVGMLSAAARAEAPKSDHLPARVLELLADYDGCNRDLAELRAGVRELL